MFRWNLTKITNYSVVYCMIPVHTQFRNDNLAHDQNLSRSNFFLWLKKALFSTKTLCFLKFQQLVWEHLPVSQYKNKLHIIVWQLQNNPYISTTKTKPSLATKSLCQFWEKHPSFLVETWAYWSASVQN